MWARKGGREGKGGEGEGKWKIPQEDEPAGKHRVSYFPGLHDCFFLFSSIFYKLWHAFFLHHVYWHVKLLAGGVQKEDRGILAFLMGVGRGLDLLLGSAAWNTFSSESLLAFEETVPVRVGCLCLVSCCVVE